MDTTSYSVPFMVTEAFTVNDPPSEIDGGTFTSSSAVEPSSSFTQEYRTPSTVTYFSLVPAVLISNEEIDAGMLYISRLSRAGPMTILDRSERLPHPTKDTTSLVSMVVMPARSRALRSSSFMPSGTTNLPVPSSPLFIVVIRFPSLSRTIYRPEPFSNSDVYPAVFISMEPVPSANIDDNLCPMILTLFPIVKSR